MADTNIPEMNRALREAQSKYTYFLLAAAGAAIGFAISQTEGDSLAWSQFPLGAAVIAWLMSFYMGCQHLHFVHLGLYHNLTILKVNHGEDPQVGRDPQMMAMANEVLRDAFKKNSDKAGWRARFQFWFLITGAVLYIVWHVVEMVLLIDVPLQTG